MAQIFLSYAREDDEPFVERLYRDLKAEGLSVWWDRKAMACRGRSFLQELRDAIADCEHMIAVIGPKAIVSHYVRAEWEHAALFCRNMIPILRLGDYSFVPDEITTKDMPSLADRYLSKQHCVDFRVERSYRKALIELVRIVREPLPPLGPFLTAVPALPPHFLPRPADFKALADRVLEDVRHPTVITSAVNVTGLQGMGGIGKSVLAAGFARSIAARLAFPDGVVWVTCGRNPDPLAPLLVLGKAFEDPEAHYVDRATAVGRLPRLLEGRAALIVLDDVWQIATAEPFLNALGPRCRLLITTRDKAIIAALGAREISLEVLDETGAIQLLIEWSGLDIRAPPEEAKAIVDLCGGLPLALAMIGGTLRVHPGRSGNILDRLRTASLEKIRARLPNYPYPDLMRAMAVSIEALGSDDLQKRYFDLAVFPEDAPISESAVLTLWESEGVNQVDAQDCIDLFISRSLAQRVNANRITLHDLQHAYARNQITNLGPLHERLIKNYRQRSSGIWVNGPADDPYFWQYLTYHLREVGRTAEVHELLLDFRWFERIAELDYESHYVADLDRAIADFANPVQPHALVVLTQLFAARQAVQERTSSYTDEDLQTLVWLGRETTALSCAQLRKKSMARFESLCAVHEALREAERPELRILNALVDVARTLPQEGRKLAALRRAATLLAEGDDMRAASVFEEYDSLKKTVSASEGNWSAIDYRADTARARALIRTGQLEAAYRVLAGRRSYSVWDHDYEGLCRVSAELVKAGNPGGREIISILQLKAKEGSAPIHLSHVAQALRATGDRHAAAALEEALSMALNRCNYYEVIALGHVLGETGDERAGEIFGVSIECARADKQTAPWKLKDVALALCDARDPRASSICEEAIEAIKRTHSRLSPDGRSEPRARAEAFSEIALARARMQEDDRAAELFAEALALVPTMPMYDQAHFLQELALDMAKAGNTHSHDVFEQAVKARRELKRDPAEHASLLTKVALALLPTDRSAAEVVFDVCMSVIDDISDSPGSTHGTEKRMEAHFNLGLALAKAKDVRAPLVLEKAVELAREVRKRQGAESRTRFAAIDYIALVLSQTAQPRITSILQNVIQEALVKGRHDRDYALLARVATVLGEIGDPRAQPILDEAVEGALAAVKQRPGTAGTLRIVALEVRNFDPNKARELLEEVVRYVNYFKGGGSSNTFALDSTVREFALLDLERFHELQISERLNWFRGYYMAGGTIRRMCIEAFIAQDDLKSAHDVLQIMANRDAHDDQAPTEWVRAFVDFVKALASAGRLEEVRQTMTLLDNGSENEEFPTSRTCNEVARVSALIELAVALERAGDARATDTFEEAAMRAEDVPTEQRRSLYHDLARAHATFSRHKVALWYLSRWSFYDFMKAIAEGCLDLERFRLSLTAQLLKDSIKIASWTNSEWQLIQDRLVSVGNTRPLA